MSAEQQAAPATAPPRTVPVAAGTNLRRGVATKGPNNIIVQLPRDSYTALAQCAGEFVQEGGATNFWWVKISVAGHGDGWVSAVRVLEGGNNEPIDGVQQVPTVQGPTPSVAHPRAVPVAAGTALRQGVATKGPSNVIVPSLPSGSYTALAQCAGEFVQGGGATNFWWVKISVAGHGDGWVSAVRVLEGGNNEPIDGVQQVPTVQGN